MKKKLILGAITLFSVTTLAACSGSKDIATMKGGEITVEDFYNRAKTNSTNQGLVREMIVYKVFDKAYADKVNEKEIDKKFDETKKQYGDSFAQTLAQAGFTEATYKDQIKSQLAFEIGLKSHVKLTDKEKKAAWTAFHPEVTASIITLTDEKEAKKVLTEVKAKDADFAKIAKSKSTDASKKDGGKVSFDSSSTTIPAEVQTAAFKLKDGAVSDLITVTDPQTYQTTYYIVKMDKNSDKGNDMSKYSKQIDDIATKTVMADQTFVSKTIGEELKKANVKVTDDAFKTVLDDFNGTSGSTSSSSSAK
ncbi:MAG: peptidyl-prolyl cis-trans isomerase [Streptococcaceae bacterium]|jgi:foldase protein PrsA|nr:peptidyl-prolyl cis-trans isomerase [Streptococcaceae bacterium]